MVHVFSEIIDDSQSLWDQATEPKETMNHALRFENLDSNTKMLEQSGVRESLIA
jgi:hypothetical protein